MDKPPRFKQVILAIAIAIVLAFFINYSLTVIFDEPRFENYCSQEYKDYQSKESCEDGSGKWVEDEYRSKSPVSESCQGICTLSLPASQCKVANISSCTVALLALPEECTRIQGTFIKTKECVNRMGYCDLNYYCNLEFTGVNDVYRRNVFITQAILGILIVTAGIILALPSVSAGIMSGGVITIVIGIVQYWDLLNKWLRLLILGLVLIILIWLGYKRLGK